MMRRWHLLDISARKSSIVNDCEFLSSSLVLQNKQSVAPGNIGSNLGQDQNPIVTIVIYSLAHSLNSTTIVALPPIGGSSIKRQKKSIDIENNNTTIIKRYHFLSHSKVSKEGLAMRYNA